MRSFFMNVLPGAAILGQARPERNGAKRTIDEASHSPSPADTLAGVIVAATDFSKDAANALRRAALIAKRRSEPLTVMHVVSRPSLDALRDWVPPETAERLVEDGRQLLAEAAGAAGGPAGGGDRGGRAR